MMLLIDKTTDLTHYEIPWVMKMMTHLTMPSLCPNITHKISKKNNFYEILKICMNMINSIVILSYMTE